MRNNNQGGRAKASTTEYSQFSNEQLVMAAQLYYERDMSQSEVARSVGVSQPQVSRMLDLARRRGIVKISIADCTTRNPEMEEKIQAVLALRSVAVIGEAGGLTPQLARRLTAHFAAGLVSELVEKADVIAVAGGRALSELSKHVLPLQSSRSHLFVQAMGNTGTTANDWDAAEVGRRLAIAWNSPFQMLNTPAFFPDMRACKAMLRLPQIQSVLEQLHAADLALVGIGTPEDSVFVQDHSLADSEFLRLKRAGAVAEICGRYFDAEGNECPTPLKDRLMAVELDALREIPDVLAIVTGNNRGPAVLAAVRGGLVKRLVLDFAAAQALLAAATNELQLEKSGV